MFYLVFHSLKRSAIIDNKEGMYELPHELPDDLRLRNLGNKENQKNLKTC